MISATTKNAALNVKRGSKTLIIPFVGASAVEGTPWLEDIDKFASEGAFIRSGILLSSCLRVNHASHHVSAKNSISLMNSCHSPEGWSMNVHGTRNFVERCAASDFTPRVSVA